MSDSETDPEDSNVNYIPYSQRPEWSDIEPLKQNDGPYSVVRIAYTEKFSETFDYIRACMQKDEMSQRALELTKDACQLNPANYTVWCYRRKLLFHLNSDLNEELIFIGQLIREHQKNYQVWEHRRLIVEKSQIYNNELRFTSDLLRLDSKNYHPWQYRQWLLKTFNLWSTELDFVNNMIIDDIKNNSAWNQRYFVISQTTGFTDDIILKELDYVMNKIRSYPDNESSWNYLRGIARLRTINDDGKIEQFCQQMYDEYQQNECRFLYAYMIELIDLKCQEEGKKQSECNRLIELCEKLALHIDPIRKRYWENIRSRYTDKPLPNHTISASAS